MKKITILLLALGTTTTLSYAQNINNCNELFISEYVEGSQKNQAVEIYNPTQNDIDFSKYTLKIYKNGNANNPTVIQFAGTILAKDVFVCGNDQADAALIAVCDITVNNHDYGGDDAVGLYKNDTLIDMIGEIGINPGQSGWQVGIGSTTDHTLVRKFDIRGGTPYWTQSVFEWIVKPLDDFSNLGAHSSVTVDEDRIVLVIFHNPLITEGEVSAFAQNNDLILEHKPSSTLPTYTWSYTFRLGPAKCNIDPASAAIQIMLNEPAVVKFAQENIIYTFDQCFTVVNEMGLDTAAPNRMWHIENTGDVIIDTLSGTIDADADICDCWDAGYTGNGVRVAVIDGQGYDLLHQDVFPPTYKYIKPIYDCYLDTPLTGWNEWIWENNAHAMMTSGLIAGAIADNNKGIAGVAKDARIIPILTRFNTSEEIAIGIQAALRPEYNADVINMSFGADLFDSIVHNEIFGAITTGRNGLGCVMVASAGNAGNSLTPKYPAAYPEVIGVGGSNPDDFRADTSDGWPVGLWSGGVGSNYGSFYDVVAPATAMTSLDFMGAQGFNTSGNYFTATGTSFSAPVVSGIAAILLEKNPTLTWQQVREAIIKGAEKVHSADTGGVYDYNFDPLDPGRSFEMQYGRVSCINSLDSIDLFISGIETANTNELFNEFSVYNSNVNELTIIYDLKDEKNDVFMRVYDMLGRELTAQTLPANQNRAVLSIREFAKGLYVLSFNTKQGNIGKSHKFVKY